jgi:hypothetical protein
VKQKQDVRPEGLTPDGVKAYETVIKHLKRNGSKVQGEVRAFWNPTEEHSQKCFEYGLDSLLIIVYDGDNDIGRFFSRSSDYAHFKSQEPMCQALEKAGFYTEECSTYYCAVYKR